jgi:hypothetical protein
MRVRACPSRSPSTSTSTAQSTVQPSTEPPSRHPRAAADTGARRVIVALATSAALALAGLSAHADSTRVAFRQGPVAASASASASAPTIGPDLGAVTVEVDSSGLEVFLDGQSIGRSPFDQPIGVTPGHHVLRTQAPNRSPVERGFDIGAGDERVVVLHPIPLDAEVIGYDVPEGPHRDRPRDGKSPWLLVAGTAIGVAALGVGIGFNLAANDDANKANALRLSLYQGGATRSSCSAPSSNSAGACASLLDAMTSRDRNGNIAVGAYLGAAAVTGLALAYWFWPEAPKSRRWIDSMRAIPTVGDRAGGLLLTGAF